MSVHSKMCLLEIKLFSNFRAKCAKHHPGYCKYLVLCVCKHLQQQQKQKKVISIAHFSRPPLWMQQPIYFDHCGWCTAVGCNSKKKFFFKMHIKKLVMSDTKKWKKKLHASSHFRPHNVVTRCFPILKINEVQKI